VPSVQHPAQRRVAEAALRAGVDLRIVTFDESTHTAAEAARAVGAQLGQIVKSLVFVAPGEEGLHGVVALVSGSNRVDIARLAAIVEMPGLRRASADEASALTGFVIGGIPPFGHRRPLRVVMDPDLERHATVWAAAGTPNAVFPIAPEALRELAGASVAPLAADRSGMADAPRIP
jgi:prolyl-tRNA editing enzyme YbaK/EbsC (Cys-tRNA(Pro) deacylase)